MADIIKLYGEEPEHRFFIQHHEPSNRWYVLDRQFPKLEAGFPELVGSQYKAGAEEVCRILNKMRKV